MKAKKTLPTIVQWTNRRRGKARPKHTVLQCETERDRDLVKMLIGDEYMCKLEDELAPILTVKMPVRQLTESQATTAANSHILHPLSSLATAAPRSPSER